MDESVGWIFPPTNGGKEDGWNEPGIAHFTGTPLSSVARETIQNSLDGRKSDGCPVEVVFELLQVKPSDIGSNELRNAIAACKKSADKLEDRKAWEALVEAAIREVKNHFFAVGNRALIRDNGISRLWWLGKIATDVAPEVPGEFLKILLHRQDVRSALIERPSVSMNRRVLRVIYKEMLRHWTNGGQLFEREPFRGWMRALNRRGGVILLDALPGEALADLVREEAERSIEECNR